MNQADATSTLAPAVPGDLLAEVRQELHAVEHRLQAELQSEHPSVDRVVRQGPSDHPDLADWLMDQGIESVSLNPDTVIDTWLRLARRGTD